MTTNPHRISDLVATGLFSRSKIYNLIRAGKLRAVKVGGSTVVLDDDWRRLFEDAPAIVAVSPNN